MTWNFTHMVSGAWSHPPAKSGSSWNHTSTRYIPPQEEFTCFVCTFSNFWIDIGNDVAHAWCSTHVHLRLSNSWIDVGNDVGWLGRICFAFFMFILLFQIDVAHSPSLVTWANRKAISHVGRKVGRKVLSKIDHLSPLGTLITWVLSLPCLFILTLDIRFSPMKSRDTTPISWRILKLLFLIFQREWWMGGDNSGEI